MKSLFERTLLLVCLLLLSGLALAQDPAVDPTTEQFDPFKDFISPKYNAGAALMYDCEDGHWVCVGVEEHAQCQVQREQAIKDKRIQLPCMPSEVYTYKRECFQKARTLIPTGRVPSACLHPAERRRLIGFQ